jgi:peptidoglycan hydrolase CwlO-like protein
MTSHFLPFLALVVTVSIFLVGTIITLHFKSKKENKEINTNKGKTDRDIEHLRDDVIDLKKEIDDIIENVQNGHIDYDSLQKQFSGFKEKYLEKLGRLGERIARLEGEK